MSPEPLRVAQHVIRFPALTETFVLNQITGLIDRGHRVDIYARERGVPGDLPGGLDRYDLAQRVTYGPPVRNAFLRRMFAVPLVERAFGPVSRWSSPAPATAAGPDRASRRSRVRSGWWGTDYAVIHAQFGPVALKSMLARRLGFLRGKLVTSFRGYDASWWPTGSREGVYEQLFRDGDLFLPVSDSTRDRLVELGCDPRKIRVHPSGIDTRAMPYRAPSWAPGQRLRLVCVGRLVEKKGFTDAIDAVGRLVEAGRDVRLDIVGEGAERSRLVTQVQTAGLGDRVGFLGRRRSAEVQETMRQSDVCLVASVTAANGDMEGIPNVAKEAMATGLPVVATRHAGIPELIEDGVSGMLAPERDPAALADRIERLMETPHTWPELTLAARRVVETRYDSDRLNDVLVEIYRELVRS